MYDRNLVGFGALPDFLCLGVGIFEFPEFGDFGFDSACSGLKFGDFWRLLTLVVWEYFVDFVVFELGCGIWLLSSIW